MPQKEKNPQKGYADDPPPDASEREVWLRVELLDGRIAFVGFPALSGTITPPPRPKNPYLFIKVSPGLCGSKGDNLGGLSEINVMFAAE